MDIVYSAYLHYKLGDHVKDTEEGVAQNVDTVVCTEFETELHVMETSTTDDDPRNDTTGQIKETQSSDIVEAKEDTSNEDVTAAHEDTITQGDQDMDTLDSILDISSTPLMVAHATVDFAGKRSNNFLKGCKW